MEENKNFADLVDETINVPQTGRVIKGVVVSYDKDVVFIDFGSKSEGVAPIAEFYGKSGELEVEVGDEVEVLIEQWQGGLPRLSKNKADMLKETDRLKKHFDSGELISVNILEKVKGGLIADIGENIKIRAFLPASQIDIRPTSDLDSMIGKDLEVRIIKLANNDVVVSRRAFLEEERESTRKETLATLEVGKLLSGKVIKIIDQGIFVDIGGIEGFVPISELSWGRIKHPSDVVSEGSDIDTKVLNIENENRITLSYKDTIDDPWLTTKDKYQVGSTISGKVVSLTDFGVFVELEQGIEGLVHISEITWTKRFKHPKEIVDPGSTVECIVLDVDTEKKRISLSLRQIEPSPWATFKEENPQGTRITGKIVNVTDKGIFVEVAQDLVGLVRPDNIEWKGRVNPQESYKTGDEIEVVVLNTDVAGQRIGLGVKQLTNDPWDDATKNYKKGDTALKGTVKEIKDRGVVLDLENDIEGYIRLSELTDDRNITDPSKIVDIGEEITALVTGFERRSRQVNLSKTKYEVWMEKQRVSDFISSQGDSAAKLGDLLSEKLKSINKDEVL